MLKCPKCKGEGSMLDEGFLIDCPKCKGDGVISLEGNRTLVLHEEDGDYD